MPERHGPYVPELPELKPKGYPQCTKFERCLRPDGHLGPCLPCPKAMASLKRD
jgi:hypothetical protein